MTRASKTNSQSVSLTNAVIVTSDKTIEGSLIFEGGTITEIVPKDISADLTLDCCGDLLVPGFVELHTDNMERHANPRPNVDWPMDDAFLAHDSELAAAGVTTVMNGVSIGDAASDTPRNLMLEASVRAITSKENATLSRAEHFIHLRCEVSAPELLSLVEPLVDNPAVKLMSVMDHTPGQRQWSDLSKYRARMRKRLGYDDSRIDALMIQRKKDQDSFSLVNRDAIAKFARLRDLPLASHDDTTEMHVQEAKSLGCIISEFPTTIKAAKAAHLAGLKNVMGAPNLVLGGSHSGNVSALSLAQEGLLDILSSDYVPASLINGVWCLVRQLDFSLPEAFAVVTNNPAKALGLENLGLLAPGKRADIVRVAVHHDRPAIRTVWRSGNRVV